MKDWFCNQVVLAALAFGMTYAVPSHAERMAVHVGQRLQIPRPDYKEDYRGKKGKGRHRQENQAQLKVIQSMQTKDRTLSRHRG